MQEEAVKIHDRYQFEVKLSYPQLFEEDKTSHLVSMYLFVPESLGIRKTTYKKDDFYRDMQSYIRLKTPVIPLSGLVNGADSPYANLAASLSRLADDRSVDALTNAEYQLKMFCCIFKSALRDHIASFDPRCDMCEAEPFVTNYVDDVKAAVSAYRALPSTAGLTEIGSELSDVHRWGNEYISLLTRSYAYELLEALQSSALQGEHPCRAPLLDLVAEEMQYCAGHGFKSVPKPSGANETFFYYKSTLKKFVESALYLDTSIKPEGAFLEQLTFGIAAGLAMLFATVVTLFAQYIYGAITLQVVLIIIISYIFKDRIKDVLKIYFSGKLHNLLFDHKVEIFGGANKKIGALYESFTFVAADDVPQNIMKMRSDNHGEEIADKWRKETIIHYRKKVLLFSRKFRSVYHLYTIKALNDIMRFNVFSYIGKMDDPQQSLYVLENGGYRKMDGQRAYHLNMVAAYTIGDQVTFRRFRIVLNRDGISRIENITEGIVEKAGDTGTEDLLFYW